MNQPVTASVRILLCASLALLAACNEATAPQAVEAPPAEAEPAQGVTLDATGRANLGIEVTTLAAAELAQQAVGFGVVLTHDVIAQSVADAATAEAAQRQSHAALARVQGLAGTPGAFSADTLETAQRQAAADDVALALTRRKLSAVFGQNQPWRADKSGTVLDGLASGSAKIVRATFPLGALIGPAPRSLQLSRPDLDGKGQRWASRAVWVAPADPAIPGRSFFALLDDPDGEIGEGERLEVRAATQANDMGVVVPQSAIVVSAAQYWCYVETPPGTFRRTHVAADRPVEQGYFVVAGIAAGASVVTRGAGLLLGRETGGSGEAD